MKSGHKLGKRKGAPLHICEVEGTAGLRKHADLKITETWWHLWCHGIKWGLQMVYSRGVIL